MTACRLSRLGMGLAAGTIGLALALAPAPVRAAPPEPPLTEPEKPTKPAKPSKPKNSESRDERAQSFEQRYRAAVALSEAGHHAQALDALHALGRDDNAAVATMIGFVSRKLGRYDEAQVWYERALAADPANVRTWQYYGMWHAEQGNVLKAREHLDRIRQLCGGETCREYADLKGAIEGTVTY